MLMFMHYYASRCMIMPGYAKFDKYLREQEPIKILNKKMKSCHELMQYVSAWPYSENI